MKHWFETNTSIGAHEVLRPEHIILASHPQADLPLKAALSRISSHTSDFEFLVGLDHELSTRATARLLALALLDRQFNMLEGTLMPPRPPTVVLRSDGTLRHRVTRTLGDWTTDEMDRIGRFLEANQSDLLAEINAVLRGRRSSTLAVAPPEFPLRAEPGAAWSVRLDRLAMGVEWRPPPFVSLERHRHVRIEYERDRYLKHLSTKALLQRGNDIFRNVHQIDGLGRVTLATKDPRTYYWMDCFTEYLQEASLRGIGPRQLGPHLVADVALPANDDGHARTIAQTVESVVVPQHAFVKYGLSSHMSDAWRKGSVRCSPASSYDDTSLDPARRDEELTLSLDVDATLLPFVRDGDVDWTDQRFRLGTSTTMRSDFLVFCLSRSLSTRLFLDFGAAAAILIRDPATFYRRFEAAARTKCPGWKVAISPVTYFDPLNTTPGEIAPPYWKHFRYAYQDEIRIVLMPPDPNADLAPLFLDLGDLRDIADLVVVSGGSSLTSQ